MIKLQYFFYQFSTIYIKFRDFDIIKVVKSESKSPLFVINIILELLNFFIVNYYHIFHIIIF